MAKPNSRKPRAPNWPLLAVLALGGAVTLGYVFVGPLRCPEPAAAACVEADLALPPPTYAERVLGRLSELLIAAWVFLFGACLGSFLNVVVYRTPRGLTLWGVSHCPRCGHAIRPYDNVPVLGWLALRGRCRDCQGLISVRYPLVETVVGSLALGLAAVEVFAHGVNLPGYGVVASQAAAWVRPPGDTPLIAVCAYHGGLLMILFSWALIAADGQRVPGRYVAFAMGLGLAFPLVWPGVQPVLWRPASMLWPLAEPGWLTHVTTSVVGAVVGAGMGWLLGLRQRRAARGKGGLAPMSDQVLAAEAAVGLFLGWQAAVSVAVIAAALRIVAAVARGRRWAAQPCAGLATVAAAAPLQVVAWAWLARCPYWPGPAGGWLVVTIAVGLVAVLGWPCFLRRDDGLE